MKKRRIKMNNGFFTDGYNKNIKDSAPDWMNNLFEKGIEKKESTIISDLYGNNKQVNKCTICGKILLSNGSNKCPNCSKL
jgi:rubrerythrin